VLVATFILLEFSSPSRRIFIGSHSIPPSLVRRIGPSWGMIQISMRLNEERERERERELKQMYLDLGALASQIDYF
jgi:hypothetical protein